LEETKLRCKGQGFARRRLLENDKNTVSKSSSFVGWQVEATSQILGNPIGTIGYVIYQFMDKREPNGWTLVVLFPNGKFDSFMPSHQDMYLEFIHPVLLYAGYVFQGVEQVAKDFIKGFWIFSEAI
jgi:hypothetical protein